MSKLQTVIFLIRHGQTDKPFSSDPGVDGERQLTEEGRAQIKKVGAYLRAFAPTAIYSSPVSRAVETAQIIKEGAEIPGQMILEPVLAEMYHGQAQGYAERAGAIKTFFNQLVSQHAGEHVVLSSHEDPIESIVEHFGFNSNELDFPCLVSQGYRVVFAGDIPVECQKINPAGVS